jgi:hypothetical protein
MWVQFEAETLAEASAGVEDGVLPRAEAGPVCVSRKALRHRDRGHFKGTTWTSADDDGDENGGRFEILSPRNPLSSPFSSTGSDIYHPAGVNATGVDSAAASRHAVTMNVLRS